MNSLFKKGMLFWDIRSRFYWNLESFMPYKKLVEDIIQGIEIKPNQHILDAGCGIGIFEKLVTEKNIPDLKIEAVDLSENMLKQAQKKLKNNGNHHIKFRQVNLDESLTYKDNIFDAIVSNNVIYALSNPGFTMREFYRTLKGGGKLVLSTPRPGASIKELIQEHLNSEKSWQIKNLVLLIISSFVYLPFDFIISFRIKRGEYHPFSKEKLAELLLSSGFKNIEINHSYANQNFLVVADK